MSVRVEMSSYLLSGTVLLLREAVRALYGTLSVISHSSVVLKVLNSAVIVTPPLQSSL